MQDPFNHGKRKGTPTISEFENLGGTIVFVVCCVNRFENPNVQVNILEKSSALLAPWQESFKHVETLEMVSMCKVGNVL
jgi:hypothetical protein